MTPAYIILTAQCTLENAKLAKKEQGTTMYELKEIYISGKRLEMETRELWTDGRRGCVACISIDIYPHSIVATADPERITQRMMERALDREFPRHTFYPSNKGGDYLRADADRWTDDGIA